MAYVEESCSQCGLILPKNQLTREVSEVRTGRISGALTTGTYASGKARYSFKSGQQVFETREEWLCADCHDDRLARIAAANRTRLIGWSFVALAVVVILAFLRLSAISSPPASSTAPKQTPMAVVRDNRPAVETPPLAEEQSPQEDAATSPAPSPQPPISATQLFTVDGEDLTQNLAFRAAAREALETGETVLWGDHNGGEVSVGPLDDTGGRACRTLAYNVGGERSSDIFMCRNAEGRWSPR